MLGARPPRDLRPHAIQHAGLHSMVEDWVLRPDPADTTARSTILTVTVGIEAARPLRPFPALVRAALKGPLKGAAGIVTQFP